MEKRDCGVVFLCGGSGIRMGEATKDKVLHPVGGRPVFAHSWQVFGEAGFFDEAVFVCRDNQQESVIQQYIATAQERCGRLRVRFAKGGARRQDSVLAGLRELEAGSSPVFIHDCARPLITEENLRSLLEAVLRDGAACLARRVTDTIKRARQTEANGRLCQLEDLDRRALWAMETPQVFRRDWIIGAYEAIERDGVEITDDTAAAAQAGRLVTLVENSSPNLKVTRPDDLAVVDFLMRRRAGRGRAAGA